MIKDLAAQWEQPGQTGTTSTRRYWIFQEAAPAVEALNYGR
jgi:hypothetical protein